MANPSIFAAFERMWQHVANVVSTKADSSHSHSISNVTDLQSVLDGKVPTSRTVNGKALEANIVLSASDVGASPSSHRHDEDYDTKGSAASALESAKSYADTAADTVKNDLLNGAGTAYDTLKELGDLIDENVDAIEALETVAAGKADKVHDHDDRYYTESEIDTKLSAKSDSNHNHDDNYLTKESPNATGSFSLNRKESTSIGTYSVAEGYNNTATGRAAHAEGEGTTASAAATHAEGNGTTASSWYAHAEGEGTTASARAAHAEGGYSTAKANYSHAEGFYTVAASTGQHVQGKHNIEDSNGVYAHIVGNGDGNNSSNAHTLDWDGNAWYAGTVKVGGTSYDDAVEVATKDHDHSFIIETNKNLEQKFWRGTKEEYDAIETKDDTTMYIVLDGEDAVIGGGVGSLEELGVFASAEELNYVDGVTSNIQAQIDGKANLAHIHSVDDISDIEGVAFVDNDEYTDSSAPLNADTLGGKDISYFAQKSDIKPKAGFIYPLATPNVPEGFLLCDGKAYSRTEYVELFAAIGTYYGEGDGSTTFNVPNLQTRVPVGAGDGYELGSVGGEAEHTLTEAEIPPVGIYNHTGSTRNFDWRDGIVQAKTTSGWHGGLTAADTGYEVVTGGGGGSHNNMQPYTVINYIISTGKDNTVYIRDVITGAQVMPLEVQYGGTGATTVYDARKNLGVKDYKRNLLDNSDFTNAVNQRGAVGDINAYQYHIDRWYADGNPIKMEVDSDGITFLGGINQKLEHSYNGKVLTFAVKVNGEIFCCSATIESVTAWTQIVSVSTNSGSIAMNKNASDALYVNIYNSSSATVEWAALYEGEYTVETLPPYVPKGYTAELLECQRYYCRSAKDFTSSGAILRHAVSQWVLGDVEFPVEMRAVPTITIYSRTGTVGGLTSYTDSTDITGATVHYQNKARFCVNSNNKSTTGVWYYFHYEASADL